VKDYKAIFDGIESTLFEVGSRTLSRDQIRAALAPSKHLFQAIWHPVRL
jgi:hypothetical protein